MLLKLNHKLLIRQITLGAALLALAACGTTTPTPDPDGPRLVGFDTLPKAMATIGESPTPDAPQVQATHNSQLPTATLPPATPTPSTTPNVGIFMGAVTLNPALLFPTGTRLPPGAAATALAQAQAGSNSTAVSINVGGNTVASNCTVPPAAEFAKAITNAAVESKIGCPRAAPFKLNMVVQPFQNGFMFWRETKDIYILSTANLHNGAATDTFWRVSDTWNESQPASDPGQVPPAGLLQPVRGFGLVWRNTANIRSSVGWALSGEQPYQATWQDFDHGWMMSNNNGTVFALVPTDGPPPTTGFHFGPLPQ